MVPSEQSVSQLRLDGKGALFQQLARALKTEILEGRHAPGSQMPATRTLATTLRLSRNTVLTAYEMLSAEQLVVSRPGSGTRVTGATATPKSRVTRSAIVAQSRYSARTRLLAAKTLGGGNPALRLDMQYGSPLVRPELFAAWRRKQVAAAPRVGPRYPPCEGLHSLRCAIVDYLLRRRGVECGPDDVIIVSGTQQGLSLVARVLVDEGQSVVIEDPYYESARHALLAHGARLVSVRVDSAGLVTDELPARPPRLIHVTPSHQFPSGAVMSLERRIQLLNYAATHRCWIFEDDYDGELHYDQRPLAALSSLDVSKRVIYSGTFSKTLFPGLRLGYMVCPQSLRSDLSRAKDLDDRGCSAIEQIALASFLESRQYEKHLRKSMIELRKRRRALLKGLARHLNDQLRIDASHGGMHVVAWFRTLSYTEVARLISHAAQRGLGLYPIHHYYQVRPAHPGLMLGFAGLTPNQLTSATDLLGRCVREISRAR
jgi:GntR family transcriptional regulator/MocR family aminotransferase